MVKEQKFLQSIKGDSQTLYRFFKNVYKGKTVGKEVSSHTQFHERLILSTTDSKGLLKPWEEVEKSLFFCEKFKNGFEGKVKFLPLERLNDDFALSQVKQTINNVLESGQFTSGPYINKFESALKTIFNVKHVILCSSGTDALTIALRSVGINTGDEVIIPPNSFAATENSVYLCGATPILADIDEKTLNLCPKSVESLISTKTKCILPVHLYGRSASIEKLAAICAKHNLKLLEDACQASNLTGLAGSSDCAILSFNPFKNLGAFGKAGAIITNNDEIANKSYPLSYHGFKKGAKNIKEIGFGQNSRIDNLQAAILLEKLHYLSLQNFKRICLAYRYIKLLKNLETQGKVGLPEFNGHHCWHMFPILIKGGFCRDQVKKQLDEFHKVETEINYPILSHHYKTSLHKKLYQNVSLKVAERTHKQLLHIPFHHNLTFLEQGRVVESLEKTLRG